MSVKNLISTLLRCLLFSLVFHVHVAWSGLLVKEDVERMFSDKFIVGDIQPNMPLWPLFIPNPMDPQAKPELKAYVFETIDFEPVRGYGGKPIDVMVVMDVDGHFFGFKVVGSQRALVQIGSWHCKVKQLCSPIQGVEHAPPDRDL